MQTKRYFVKCSACDQVFWMERARAPVPEHGRWNRRTEQQPPTDRGCAGAGRPGHWIGEDLDGGPIN